jgi:hypothetical protein
MVGTGDEVCEPLSALFQAVANHPPIVSCLLLQALFTESSRSVRLLAPPPFSGALSAPCPLCCMSFSVPCLLFRFFVCLFLVGRGSVYPGAMLIHPKHIPGNTTCCLFAHLLVCFSQADLELASGSLEALLFSQCNVAWRSFVLAGGWGCWSFASSWCFFSCHVWIQHLSKIFDLPRSCCLLPPSSHHLGSSSARAISDKSFYP